MDGREGSTEREEGGREEATEREVASSPGPTQILSRSRGEKSPQLRDKIWVGPGDEATSLSVASSLPPRFYLVAMEKNLHSCEINLGGTWGRG